MNKKNILQEIEQLVEDMIDNNRDIENVDDQKIIDMMRTHPDPTPDMIKNYAQDFGEDEENLQSKIYNLLSDMLNGKINIPKEVNLTTEKREEKIVGGLADNHPKNEFDPGELRKGIKVEAEHTNDVDVASEIARDHLSEDPDYYKKLAKMESKKPIMELKRLKEVVSKAIQEACSKHNKSIEEIFSPSKETLSEKERPSKIALAYHNENTGLWGLIDDESRELVTGLPFWGSYREAVLQAPKYGYIVKGQMEGPLPPWLEEKIIGNPNEMVDIKPFLKSEDYDLLSDFIRNESPKLAMSIKSGGIRKKDIPQIVQGLTDLARGERNEVVQQKTLILAKKIERAEEGEGGFVMEKEKLEEVTPPGREDQVKALKGKVDNPWAVAWASYNKRHGNK